MFAALWLRRAFCAIICDKMAPQGQGEGLGAANGLRTVPEMGTKHRRPRTYCLSPVI